MKFEGIDEMLSKVRSLGDQGIRVENRALRAGAEELRETMARNAPGPSDKNKDVHLPENIKMSGIKNKDAGKAIEVGPGRESFYAIFLEFGTTKMSPKSFVEPSINESGNRVLLVMADELRNGLL